MKIVCNLHASVGASLLPPGRSLAFAKLNVQHWSVVKGIRWSQVDYPKGQQSGAAMLALLVA